MPTMKDPITGEEKEISKEELMRALRDGRLSVRQEIHHADGSVTSSAVFGNDFGDGVDRSVNVFGSMSDILQPALQNAKKIKEANADAEKLFIMDNSGANYEMTIDDTENPVMHIVTCTKDKVHVARYVRDERKSVGKPLSEEDFLFSDGKIEATADEIKANNSLLFFAIGAYAIRQLLEKRGQLQELKKLDNRSVGVLITVKNDEIITKTVRGRNRPDLPCLMFGGLFASGVEDAVMMRPYMDELMGESLREGMSIEDLTKEAEDGDPDCMESLAQAYLNGDSVEQNFKKAAYWWKKLAETGNAIGQFNIGLFCAKGCGVKRDFAAAADWMEKAAEAGDEDAPQAAEKYREAAENLQKANAGDVKAAGALAGFYMGIAGSLNQAGPGNDYIESLKWARIAVDNGEPEGFWVMALAYEHGRGVDEDVNKAISFYKEGADRGHAGCQHSLGCYYARGDVLKKDNRKAFELFKKAAEQGYGLAMKDLGRCYQFAWGCTGNMKTAVEWYEKALEVIDDPELAQKTALFKTMGESDSKWDEDYPEIDEPDAPDVPKKKPARKPKKNPEELAAEKKREEEKAKAEAEKKAEAERVKEEKRRAAEQQEREKSEALAAVANEIRNENDAYNEKSGSLAGAIEKATQEIEALNEKKKALGLFKTKEKKAIDTQIAAENGRIAESKEALQKLEQTHNAVIDCLNKKQFLLDPAVGSKFTFGSDPNSRSNAALRWKVIRKTGDSVVLLTECVVALKSYYRVNKWLKDEFYQTAFTREEQSVMEEMKGEYVRLPTSAQTAHEPSRADVSEYLRAVIIRESREDGVKYHHTALQTQNWINTQLNDAKIYWLETESCRDGFAMTSGGRIGAGAEYGVRPVIKINVKKLRERA